MAENEELIVKPVNSFRKNQENKVCTLTNLYIVHQLIDTLIYKIRLFLNDLALPYFYILAFPFHEGSSCFIILHVKITLKYLLTLFLGGVESKDAH